MGLVEEVGNLIFCMRLLKLDPFSFELAFLFKSQGMIKWWNRDGFRRKGFFHFLRVSGWVDVLDVILKILNINLLRIDVLGQLSNRGYGSRRVKEIRVITHGGGSSL